MVKKNVCKLLVLASFSALIAVCVLLCGCQPSEYQPTLKASTVDSSLLVTPGTLTVGVDTGNPPLASKASKIQGIDVDVASAIADELGLKVEFVDVGTGGSTSLESKKVDVVMGLDAGSAPNNMAFSTPYLQTGSALFAMSESTTVPTKGDGSIIEGQMASSAVLKAQNQFDASSVKVKAELGPCFEDLAAKSVNYVAADAVIGTYTSFINNNNAKLIGMLQRPSGYCAAVSKDNTQLLNSVNTAVENLKNSGIFDVISNKWLASTMNLDSLPKTAGADNEALGSDVESGVYAEVSNTAKQN